MERQLWLYIGDKLAKKRGQKIEERGKPVVNIIDL